MAKIDQNGKRLVFRFCSLLAIFMLFKNGSKTLKTTLGVFGRFKPFFKLTGGILNHL